MAAVMLLTSCATSLTLEKQQAACRARTSTFPEFGACIETQLARSAKDKRVQELFAVIDNLSYAVRQGERTEVSAYTTFERERARLQQEAAKENEQTAAILLGAALLAGAAYAASRGGGGGGYSAPADGPARLCSQLTYLGQCRVCYAGKACGNSCIERTDICHVGPGCACNMSWP